MIKEEEIRRTINKIMEIIYELYKKDLKDGNLDIKQYIEPAYAVGNQTIKKSRFSMAKQASLFNKYENEK
jgi:hypothetical protein